MKRAPCARCQAPLELSPWALDVARACNRALNQRDEAPLRLRDIALCPGCYETHRRDLVAATYAEIREEERARKAAHDEKQKAARPVARSLRDELS